MSKAECCIAKDIQVCIMERLFNINIIRLFDFYLAVMFVLSLFRRRQIYWDGFLLGLTALRQRRLLDRVGGHKDIFLSGSVLRPIILALCLMIIQYVTSRVVFPNAEITLAQLIPDDWPLVVLLLMFAPMFAVDFYSLLRVSRFDRGEAEKYLQKAETWLGWRASAVRFATLGIVNPRRIVDVEMRKGLIKLGATVSGAFYWVSIQVMLRTLFGLTIWLLWAVPR